MEEVIDNLLDISEEIFNCYEKMNNLENLNKKETPFYQKKSDELKRYIFTENNLYNQITSEKISDILNKLEQKENINNFCEDIRIICFGNKKDFIKRRIVIKLLSKKITYDNETIKEMGMELSSDLKVLGINFQNNPYFKLSKLLELNDNIKNDYIFSLLYISNNRNIKYILSYLYSNIEIELIKNSFELKNDLYWISKLYKDFNNIPNDTYNYLLSTYGIELIGYILNQYEKDEKVELVIRTSLLFCNKFELAALTKEIPIIGEILEKYNQDKEIPFILNLKLER